MPADPLLVFAVFLVFVALGIMLYITWSNRS